MSAEIKIKNYPTADLKDKAATYNPTLVDPKTREATKASIKEFGFLEPIVFNLTTQTIIGGHTRLEIASELGIEEVPVLEVQLTPAQEKMANLGLNKITDPWDAEKLDILLTEILQSGADLDITGYNELDAQEINAMIHTAKIENADFQTFKIKVGRMEKKIITDALRKAKQAGSFDEYPGNSNSNGNALARICADYSTKQHGTPKSN